MHGYRRCSVYTYVRECLTVGFLCAVPYLSWALCSLSVSVRGKRSWQAAPRTEIREMGCLHRISFISFSIWWKGLFTTLFWYGLPFGLWLYSLVTCKVWSLDLYLKKLLCITVYILTQNSIKHPCSTRDLGPRVLLSLSLFLADILEHEGLLCNPGNISLFPSFTFSLLTPDHQVPVH